MLNDRLIKWLARRVPEQGTNFTSNLPIVLSTDQGLQRAENQDRVAVMRVNAISGGCKPFIAIALADGMGGMKDGSGCAVRAISSFFHALAHHRGVPPRERLELALDYANNAVNEFSGGYGGTTLSVILISLEGEPLLANIGDSRIYAVLDLKTEKCVERLTVDDSLEESVGGYGRELLQFLGMGEGLMPHINLIPKGVKKVLITSDGVHFIHPKTLSDVLCNASESKQIAERLSTIVRWCGAPDNATLAVIDLPALRRVINSKEDTGIELWDPFSALHLIWLKQESLIENISPSLSGKALSKGKLSKSKKNIESLHESPDSTNSSKKSRKKSSLDIKDKAEDISLIFELNTEPPKE